jgi:acyl-CoA synthetase (AMP-forming)/AMP-acid ligase II
VQRAESALGVPFTITFAQTEASPCITQTRQDDSADDRARTLGRPHPHVEVKIADPVTGEALPAGTGVPDEHWGEHVAAFIKPAAGHTTTEEELTAYCRAHLAAHKTPRHWVFTDAFPLTGSGKVQKFLLREQFSSGQAPALPAARYRVSFTLLYSPFTNGACRCYRFTCALLNGETTCHRGRHSREREEDAHGGTQSRG